MGDNFADQGCKTVNSYVGTIKSVSNRHYSFCYVITM